MTADIQRWTTARAAPSEGGGFVAYGDYLALKRRLEAAHDRIAALEAKCALFAASLAQSEREVEERDARIAGKVDGWKLVPVKPTMDMVVNGFESWPDEHFSRPEEWAAYQAMSGCQRAAHRARLCYAAMLAAAPTDTVAPAIDAQPAQNEGVRRFNYLCSLLPEGFHWSDPLTPDVMNHVVSGASAQSEGLRVDAWQPIETAPKDGRMFLVWVEAARFGEDDNGQPFEQDCSTADFAEWRKCGDDGYINYFAHPFADREYATHWQPLPAPPAAMSQHTGDKDD